jgi:uncharacterized protein HemX
MKMKQHGRWLIWVVLSLGWAVYAQAEKNISTESMSLKFKAIESELSNHKNLQWTFKQNDLTKLTETELLRRLGAKLSNDDIQFKASKKYLQNLMASKKNDPTYDWRSVDGVNYSVNANDRLLTLSDQFNMGSFSLNGLNEINGQTEHGSMKEEIKKEFKKAIINKKAALRKSQSK